MLRETAFPTLADLLSQHMNDAGIGDARLANRVNQHFDRPAFLHRSTVRNWRTGTSKTVKDWCQLAGIATVLGLSEAETDALLLAANWQPIRQLEMGVGAAERPFLATWLEPTALLSVETKMSHLTQQMDQLLTKIMQLESRSLSKSRIINHYIPYRQNPFFVGRQSALMLLADSLVGQAGVTIVSGLGGIGKTQLAVEFVHRYSHCFGNGIYWLNFDEPKSIAQQITTIAERTQMIFVPQTLSQSDQAWHILHQWLRDSAVLLVFDGCEDVELLHQWLPPTRQCRVLVTSRCGMWEPVLGGFMIPLDVLHREHSIQLLQKYRDDLNRDIAADIAARLGHLPLALHLAGNFLATYGDDITPAIYLQELCRLRGADLLAHPSLRGRGTRISPTDHLANVAHTFALSYQQLDCCEACDALALALLQHAARWPPNELMPCHQLMSEAVKMADEFAGIEAMQRLVSLGLLNRGEEGVQIHDLVARFVRGAGEC